MCIHNVQRFKFEIMYLTAITNEIQWKIQSFSTCFRKYPSKLTALSKTILLHFLKDRYCVTLCICNIHQSINQSIHWHIQNLVIPCRSQEPLPFLPVTHFFLPLLSANHSSILPHFIQPSICWSASWSYCFQIHVQYSFGNPIFFHSLCMSKPT